MYLESSCVTGVVKHKCILTDARKFDIEQQRKVSIHTATHLEDKSSYD